MSREEEVPVGGVENGKDYGNKKDDYRSKSEQTKSRQWHLSNTGQRCTLVYIASYCFPNCLHEVWNCAASKALGNDWLLIQVWGAWLGLGLALPAWQPQHSALPGKGGFRWRESVAESCGLLTVLHSKSLQDGIQNIALFNTSYLTITSHACDLKHTVSLESQCPSKTTI